MNNVWIVLFPLLACAALCFGQNAPTDTAAAWKPMAGSPAAEAANIDGRDAIHLPCRLQGNNIPRASWDCAVALDLALSGGMQLEVLCKDPSSVAGFSIYFQSASGWYNAGFAPSGDGKWSSITIRKEDTGLEGTPGGWAKVSAIRISAWRGLDADADLYVRAIRPIPASGGIAILRGESAAELRPAESNTVQSTTRQMAAMLSDLGLPYYVLSDLDVNAQRLRQTKLLVLPHNPVMPEPAMSALSEWLEGDGRLIAFYGVPGELAQACGFTSGTHVRESQPGQFAAIAADAAILQGAPAKTAQRSWNINDARPTNERVKVAAEWLDQAGQKTGFPAILASDRITYMTHILLPDDAANKGRLLAAMLAHVLPETRQTSAKAAIDRVGQIGQFAGLDDLAKSISGTRGEVALQRALAQRESARGLLAKGDAVAAADAARESHSSSIEAWCTAQEPQANEWRGFWCHRPFGIAGKSWDESIKLLADNGFTAIVPNMLWGGSAAYPSKVLPVSDEVARNGDQIAACLAAARKYGLQVHVWKVNWNMGWSSPKEFTERMKREGRTQVRFDGTSKEPWLCPSHPDNQQLEIDSMVEVATMYDVDGIHFDYIRYPDQEYCFCKGCRERFEKVIGQPVANWPAEVRKDDQLREKWLEFRRSNITRVVAEVSRQVREKRPKMKISAAVFRTWPSDRDTVGQDWKLWCDRGYVDFVCPMDYTPHNAQFDSMIAGQKTWAGEVPVYPGIGLSTWPGASRDPVKLIEQIQITRKHNTGGFTIFEYDAPEAQQIVPLLGLGATRR